MFEVEKSGGMFCVCSECRVYGELNSGKMIVLGIMIFIN